MNRNEPTKALFLKKIYTPGRWIFEIILPIDEGAASRLGPKKATKLTEKTPVKTQIIENC